LATKKTNCCFRLLYASHLVESHRRATAKILSVSVVNTFVRARGLFNIKNLESRENFIFLDRALEVLILRETLGRWSPGQDLTNISLVLRAGYFKYLVSVKWRATIWQSIKDTTSRWERRRSSNNQCKHRTSGSTQFYKAVARPTSKLQRCNLAHITSYPGAESAFYERNLVDGGKQGPIQTACNGSHPSTKHHLREKHFRSTTFD